MTWKLYTDDDYKCAKYHDKLPIKCCGCGTITMRSKVSLMQTFRYCNGDEVFCSPSCASKNNSKMLRPTTCKCFNCSKDIQVSNNQINRSKTKRFFCSQSCACTYNNTHKKYGTRISKLEKWIQSKLTEMYSFEIHFNRKNAINSELDIYIPSLNLAFELNGIFHYEPIFGKEQLDKLQNNDNRKYQACIQHGIELCIIDTSKQKRVTEKSSQQFLDIIVNIIKAKI
jgi:hypothetical protein